MNISKNIAAELAGAVASVALGLDADTSLRAAAIFPLLGQPIGNPLFLLAATHRTIFAVLGAYITARFAPSRTAILGRRQTLRRAIIWR